MRALMLAILLAIPTVTLIGCFEFDEPVCSFKCATAGGPDACPEDYECRSDGYCHRHDSTEVCTFSDAALVNDLSAMVDMPGNMNDGATTDAGTD
jgi:hypothetical protein